MPRITRPKNDLATKHVLVKPGQHKRLFDLAKELGIQISDLFEDMLKTKEGEVALKKELQL